jgi:hypothetical protein
VQYDGTTGKLLKDGPTIVTTVGATGADTSVPTEQGVREALTQQTEVLTAGENLVAGDVCYLKSDNKYWKADADAEATASTELRMALASISADATGVFLRVGPYTTTGLTVGPYYVSTTPGAITATAPSGSGDIVRLVGMARSSTNLYFDPDQTYLELA